MLPQWRIVASNNIKTTSFNYCTNDLVRRRSRTTDLKKRRFILSSANHFYGSSSIRLWKNLYDNFEEFAPINLGLGGSTLEACVYFFERIVAPVQSAQKIIIYAGDNHLGDGKQPDEVFQFFIQLKALLHLHFPAVPAYYISVKPSTARW